MKKFFALVILSSGLAFAGTPDPRLFGQWHVTEPVYSDEDVTVRLSVLLESDNATLKATCLYPRNKVVEVSLVSKVEYTDKVVRPLETKDESRKGPGDQECVIAIQPIDIYYKIISDKKMEFSDVTGFQRYELHRD